MFYMGRGGKRQAPTPSLLPLSTFPNTHKKSHIYTKNAGGGAKPRGNSWLHAAQSPYLQSKLISQVGYHTFWRRSSLDDLVKNNPTPTDQHEPPGQARASGTAAKDRQQALLPSEGASPGSLCTPLLHPPA